MRRPWDYSLPRSTSWATCCVGSRRSRWARSTPRARCFCAQRTEGSAEEKRPMHPVTNYQAIPSSLVCCTIYHATAPGTSLLGTAARPKPVGLGLRLDLGIPLKHATGSSSVAEQLGLVERLGARRDVNRWRDGEEVVWFQGHHVGLARHLPRQRCATTSSRYCTRTTGKSSTRGL